MSTNLITKVKIFVCLETLLAVGHKPESICSELNHVILFPHMVFLCVRPCPRTFSSIVSLIRQNLFVAVYVVLAVPSRHYVDRIGCHIYDWSARQCSTYLGYTRKVTHQTNIFQITIIADLQGIVHWSMYKSNGYWYLVR